MSGPPLDDDTIDDILYLARVNETSELDALVSDLGSKTKHSKAELVAAAIDPYSKNSALHYAAANGHLDAIKLLLSYGLGKAAAAKPVPINAVNDAGNTPLHWAALNGHLDSVKLLIQSGADVTIINQAGHDAVFEAEINDKKEVVEWLLGAVEALENGIGQEEPTPENAEADVEMEGREDTLGSNDAHESGEAHVEEARRQMEGMKADGSSQGG